MRNPARVDSISTAVFDVGPQKAAVPPKTAASQPRISGRTGWLGSNLFRQYMVAFAVFAVVSLLNIWLEDLIGYQAIALVYLLSVVVLALFVNRGPIIFGAALTAIGWGFIAPPRFSFHISSFYDKMMVTTYFVVSLTIGQLMTRLRAHREAEMKTKLLAESERLGRTLLNSVSHELRTPIAAITGAAGGLRTSGTLTERQQKFASEIEFAGARLNRVVQSLLSAARLQSGQVRSRLDWCDVADLARVALADNADLIRARAVTVKIAPQLPLVKMDAVLTGQALGNLLANAAIHTPPGTPIEINARVDERNLVIEVADRGPGVPEDQLERIFDIFQRAPDAKPGGTGLGLAIVRGFVEAQGGNVTAANRSGGGALFAIRMPAKDSPDLPEEML
jgi:two-component system sensor histidine kinase KdpD